MQQPNTINYGATGHVANNPFAMAGVGPIATSTISEESMQPDATIADNYQAYGGYTPGTLQQSSVVQPPPPQLGQMPTYEQQYPQYQQQQ